MPHHSALLPLNLKVNKYIYVSRAKDHNCQACHSQEAITWGPCVFLWTSGWLSWVTVTTRHRSSGEEEENAFQVQTTLSSRYGTGERLLQPVFLPPVPVFRSNAVWPSSLPSSSPLNVLACSWTTPSRASSLLPRVTATLWAAVVGLQPGWRRCEGCRSSSSGFWQPPKLAVDQCCAGSQASVSRPRVGWSRGEASRLGSIQGQCLSGSCRAGSGKRHSLHAVHHTKLPYPHPGLTLEPACVGGEAFLCMSSQLSDPTLVDLLMAMFTPGKLANITNQSLLPCPPHLCISLQIW